MTTARLLLAATVAVMLPRLAQAHAVLIDSVPAVNGSVPAGPLLIKLRYNSRIDLGRSRVSLAGPGAVTAASAHRLAITGTPARDEFDAKTVGLAPGPYVIRWQALALDGHITRGEVAFTVAPR